MRLITKCNAKNCRHRKTYYNIVYDPDYRKPCPDPKNINCKGLMTIDAHRMVRKNRIKSTTGGKGLCKCDAFKMSIHNSPHRKGCVGCKYYDDLPFN